MTLPLAPLSLLYGAATRTRHALYRAGVLPVQAVGVPVFSVGNITAGGTGKTPLVEWLARALAHEGRRVCILTRGYGRTDARRRVLVSDGTRVLADARTGGDEPRLLAENLRGLAAVVSDADRGAAARWALTNLNSDAFILDDGFQHLRLARDFDIVTLDATAPWGGGHLLPRGRLRETPAALARADCIVLTRAEQAPDLAALRAEVQQLSGARPVFTAHTHTRRCTQLNVPAPSSAHANSSATTAAPDSAQPDTVPSDTVPADTAPPDMPTQPVVAFCALGNPQAFFTHARRAGGTVVHTRAFPDHHNYTQADVAALARAAAQHDARALVTTAKDAVKLKSLALPLPCYILEIELVVVEAAELRALIRAALARQSG